MPIRLITNFDTMPVSILTSLEQLGAEDIAILSYENQRNFFKSIEWFACLTKSLSDDDISIKLYIASSSKDATQRCYLFCYIDGKKNILRSLCNFYTMEFSIIFSCPECPKKELLHELFACMAKEIPANNFIKLECLYDETEETSLLYGALRASNFLATLYIYNETYFANVANKSFNEYYQNRPSTLINTIRRKEKKTRKLYDLRVKIYTDYDEKALDDYINVYESSWKDSERYPNFIRNLCYSAAQLGTLRMGILYIDESPVAAQIWLLSGTKAVIYKLAYDQKFQNFSVGSILTKEIFEFVIKNDKLEEINYGLGSEGYKKDWMDNKKTLVGIDAFNLNTYRGTFMAASYVIAGYIKKHVIRRRS
jgi:hypothetical protein